MGKRNTFLRCLIIGLILFKTTISEHSESVNDESNQTSQNPSINRSHIDFTPEPFVLPTEPKDANFYEVFVEPKLSERWLTSMAKREDDLIGNPTIKYKGKWSVSTPDIVVVKRDYALIAKSKSERHAISSKLNKPFHFGTENSLIVQYDVKFQKSVKCGGAYIKLLTGKSMDLRNFSNKTQYSIMFGPDKCSVPKIHFIIRYRNPKTGKITEHVAEQVERYDTIAEYFEKERFHLYTLVIRRNDTYRIYVDEKEMMRGSLRKTMRPPMMSPKEIEETEKPESWDDRAKIDDPNAKKPDDWDEEAPARIEDPRARKPDDWLEDEPEYVLDEKASKPADWDDNLDGKYVQPFVRNPKCIKVRCGTWKRPFIPNPAYKGKWRPPLIDNKKYQGQWSARKILNPDYFKMDFPIFKSLRPIHALGIELWTTEGGVVFDDFLVTNDKKVADQLARETFREKVEAELRSRGKPGPPRPVGGKYDHILWWIITVLSAWLLVMIILLIRSYFSDDSYAEAKKQDEPMDDDGFSGDEEALEVGADPDEIDPIELEDDPLPSSGLVCAEFEGNYAGKTKHEKL